MALKSLSLNSVVKVIVNLAARMAPRKAFDLGLIIGSSTVIPTDERIRIYEAVEDMLEDGFTNSSPEYLAALLYFSAQKKPDRLAVGVQAEKESVLEAVQACREANSEWYTVYCCKAEKQDIKEVSAYIEAATPSTMFMFTTQDTDAPSGKEGNIFEVLKEKSLRRTLGQYSTESEHAVASILGYAMGANTGTRNSAYTLAYKAEPGVTPENLSTTQVETIKGNYGNVYINRGEYYNVFEQGVTAANIPFDEMINLDKLANDIQLNVMDLLYQYPKVPQTESGITQIVNAIAEACEQSVLIGFIAPGVWKGQDILELVYGDTLPKGYLIQPDSIDNQSQADREARKAPPIYVSIKLAGAIEFVTIQVDVNR